MFMNIIEARHLEFQYASREKKTLNIENFSLVQGEKLFLFGPSGSGKTTFLEMCSAVLVPQKGQVFILNQEVSGMSPSQRDRFRAAHIGYIFQNFNLIPYLSVKENISLPLYLSTERRKKVPVEKESSEIEKVCESLGILELLSHPVTELSIGQQQRVAAARALVGSPELILADEPTSALDSDHREKFIRLLFDCCALNNTSVVFVSHDRSLEKLFSRSLSLAEINKI